MGKTLNEVAEIVGLSRRIIQECENNGLATKPEKRNKYGHLVYDDKQIERLWLISFFKELKYNNSQIQKKLNDYNLNRHQTLIEEIALMEEKIEKLKGMVEIVKTMDKMDAPLPFIQLGLPALEGSTFKIALPIMGTVLSAMPSREDLGIASIPEITEEDKSVWNESMERILDFFHQEVSYESEHVQQQVACMHSVMTKLLSRSVLIFSWINICFAEGTESAATFDDEYGKGSANYVYQSVRHYCTVNKSNPLDQKLYDSCYQMELFYKKGYSAETKEVQEQVRKIHEFFSTITILTKDAQLKFLRSYGGIFEEKTLNEMMDRNCQEGLSNFYSNAIRFYCNNIDIKNEGGLDK